MPGKKSLAKQEKQQAEKTVKKSSERKEKTTHNLSGISGFPLRTPC